VKMTQTVTPNMTLRTVMKIEDLFLLNDIDLVDPMHMTYTITISDNWHVCSLAL